MTIKCFVERNRIITEASENARLVATSGFGTVLADGRIHLSLFESVYLMKKKKLVIYDRKNKKYDEARIVRRQGGGTNFWTNYAVYQDLRDRGYVVNTALKFGATFRVYDKGTKPGQAHAKWIVFPVQEHVKITWHDWSAKNRVAHSTKKKLLIAVVDDELDVCYWEARWLRP